MASVSAYADQEQEENQNVHWNFKEFLSTLRKDRGWEDELYFQYQGFWYPHFFVEGIIWAQQNFRARDTDIFVATFPKCGTTWVKALMYAIKNRKTYNHSSHPLLSKSPHECVPFVEFLVHQDNPIDYLDSLPSPRLLGTHIPHESLPESILDSGTRIVCIARNPKDVFISLFHFTEKIRENVNGHVDPLSIDDAFELFCKGVSMAGPFWDHILGYWEASLKSPDKVLFMKYEDIKSDPESYVKRMAEFTGRPFSSEEEKDGVVQEIIKFCSFENLSSLEVNKNGTFHVGPKIIGAKIGNDAFYRRGKTGDSKKELTPEILERLDRITEQKLGPSGLKF